jgi:hypothetical protein
MSKTNVSLELINFKQELKRIEEEVKALGNIEIEKRIDYAVDNLRVVTPVDTGEARSGWVSRKYKDSDKLIEALIINEVEHISVLNNGHSKQAPRYFIEQVLTKIGILTP